MKRALYVLAALAAAMLAIRIALPSVLERMIATQGTRALGLPVSVANVDLSLHTATITVEGLHIGGDQAPRLRSGRILGNLHFLNLFRRRGQFEVLEIGRAEIALALLPDGTLAPLVRSDEPGEAPDVTVIVPAEEPAPEPERETESGGAWPLWVDRLSVADLELLLVTPATPDVPPLQLTLQQFELSDFRLVDGNLRFGSVGLAGIDARLRRDLQFEAAEATATQAETASTANAGEPGARLSLDDFSIEDSRITLQTRDAEVELALSASAQNVRLDPGSRFPVELRLDREGGGLKLSGEAGANPPAFVGTLSLEGLSLANTVEIIDPDVPFRIAAGTLAGHLDLDFALGKSGASARATGHLQVDGADGTARGRELELKRCRLEVTDLTLEPAPEGEPRIRATAAGVDAEGISFHDEAVDPSFLLQLATVDASARSLRLPDRDADFALSAKGFGGLAVQANGILKAGVGRTDVALAGVQLNELSGYAKGSGIRFDGGTAGLKGHVSSDGPRHDFDVELTLDDLDVGQIDPGIFQQTFGMTPDLALGLLSDPSGSVELPLHFEIDPATEGTAFSLSRLLAGALSQAVTGILTSPLKGLGVAKNVILGDDGDLALEPLPFPQGEKKWEDDQELYLDALARALEARPGVHMRLTGLAGEDESERLARARAERVADALRERRVAETRIEVGEPGTGMPGVALAIVPAPATDEGGSD